MTSYGDFNGDCYVNAADEALFPLAGDWSLMPVPTLSAIIPLYDYNGDCLVDDDDHSVFYLRLNQAAYNPIAGCTPGTRPSWCSDGPPTWSPFPEVCVAPGTSGRYFNVDKVPSGEDTVALLVEGDSADPAVGCLSLYVQTDGTLEANSVYQLPEDWDGTYISDEEVVPESIYKLSVEYAPGLLSAPQFVTAGVWGDVNGSGVLDIDDLMCMLDAFSGFYVPPCTHRGADLVPPLPNDLIDVDDMQALLSAFAGDPYCYWVPWPCESEENPCQQGFAPESFGGDAGMALVSLQAAKAEVAPGEAIAVEVMVSGLYELQLYQVAVDVISPSGEPLVLTDASVDTGRQDFALYGVETRAAVDFARGRMVGLVLNPLAGPTMLEPEASYYLGTFVFTAPETLGEYTIQLRLGETSLRTNTSTAVDAVSIGNVTVTVEDGPVF